MKSLALNILDIVQNSLRAEADEINISISELESTDQYRIAIEDNGKGIDPGMLSKVTDPFVTTRTKRRMGMGLPLLKHHATIAGGNMEIVSEAGKGTRVSSYFQNSHIDRQPLGDIAGVTRILIAANPGVNFTLSFRTDKGEYSFASKDVKEYLDIETFNDASLLEDIVLMINENLAQINVSGFDTSGINQE